MKAPYPQHFNRDIHKLSTLSTIGLSRSVDNGADIKNLSFLLCSLALSRNPLTNQLEYFNLLGGNMKKAEGEEYAENRCPGKS